MYCYVYSGLYTTGRELFIKCLRNVYFVIIKNKKRNDDTHDNRCYRVFNQFYFFECSRWFFFFVAFTEKKLDFLVESLFLFFTSLHFTILRQSEREIRSKSANRFEIVRFNMGFQLVTRTGASL